MAPSTNYPLGPLAPLALVLSMGALPACATTTTPADEASGEAVSMPGLKANLHGFVDSSCNFIMRGLYDNTTPAETQNRAVSDIQNGLPDVWPHVRLCQAAGSGFLDRYDVSGDANGARDYVRRLVVTMCTAPAKDDKPYNGDATWRQWTRSRAMCFIKAAEVTTADPTLHGIVGTSIADGVAHCGSSPVLAWYAVDFGDAAKVTGFQMDKLTFPTFEAAARNWEDHVDLNRVVVPKGLYWRFFIEPRDATNFLDCVQPAIGP